MNNDFNSYRQLKQYIMERTVLEILGRICGPSWIITIDLYYQLSQL